MAMTADQFAELLGFLRVGGGAGERGVDEGRRRTAGRRIEAKNFSRVQNFDGNAAKFGDWVFQIKLAMRACAPSIAELMEKFARQKEEVTMDDVEMEDSDGEKLAAEIYDIIGMTVMGEALTIVKGVQDMNGVEAYRRLFRRYSPNTPARSLVRFMEVLNPGRAKDVHDLANKLENWELKVAVFEKEDGESVSEKVKVAVLLGMCTQELQDLIVQRSEKLETYKDVKATVMNFVDNRKAQYMPTPMDIGNLDEDWGNEEYEEVHLDEVGRSQCYRCGGTGHMARDCATPDTRMKGKGKGDMKGEKGKGMKGQWQKGGFGKGEYHQKGSTYGKGDYGQNYFKGNYMKGQYPQKGFFQKGTSKGKGYQGECWNCGKVGHKSNECTKMMVDNVMEEVVEEECEVGGLWRIGNLEVEKECKEMRPTPQCGDDVGSSFALEAVDCIRQSGTFTVVKEMSKSFTSFGRGEIVVDSGAGESVWPSDLLKEIPTKIADVDKRNNVYVAANGNKMPNRGKKEVKFRQNGDKKISAMVFQVTDVKRPLASVKRIVEKGNVVVFGPEESFVQNIATGKKMEIVERNGFRDGRRVDGDRGRR